MLMITTSVFQEPTVPDTNLSKTTKDDLMIVLGDAGVNYYENERDALLKEDLEVWPITFFFVRGNHERDPANISTYVEQPFNEGKVLIEPDYPSLLFAKDGAV
ncbi:metallophosphoesterase [Alkaliphilus metalliredigens]|uniref:metallophosphoesterase n=1 Tax=Alkaliphilus metalliredigens TaxID=208226 RepID=UPI0012ED62BB|nr:metallophosphoesterase [Alkaliphilus metalliredigens]